MRVTDRALAEFGTALIPSDLHPAAGQPPSPALPHRILESLIRFEGALAWEAGEPRDCMPATIATWARHVWLAGWDDMFKQYGAREH